MWEANAAVRRTFVAILPVALASLTLLAACGEEDKSAGGDSTKKAPPAAKKPQKPSAAAKAPGPEVCLMRASASGVERTDPNFWRGTLEGGGQLRIERFGSEAEAAQVVKDAADIDAAAAGRYAVKGPLKGSGAKAEIETAADCLKNG